jgi:hypothetical protein
VLAARRLIELLDNLEPSNRGQEVDSEDGDE